MSSSSRDRKRPAGQVCIGEAFSKLAKYERDSGKWKMLTRNVAIPIPPRACAADEELTLEGFVVLYRASDVDSITDYNGLLPRAWDRLGHRVHLTFFFKATFLLNCIWRALFQNAINAKKKKNEFVMPFCCVLNLFTAPSMFHAKSLYFLV